MGDGDDLDGHAAAGAEGPVHGAEEGAQVGVPDRLHHLDAHDRREGLWGGGPREGGGKRGGSRGGGGEPVGGEGRAPHEEGRAIHPGGEGGRAGEGGEGRDRRGVMVPSTPPPLPKKVLGA